ncbi:hypothetical protein D3C74_466090 [compost metagenome]
MLLIIERFIFRLIKAGLQQRAQIQYRIRLATAFLERVIQRGLDFLEVRAGRDQLFTFGRSPGSLDVPDRHKDQNQGGDHHNRTI